MRNQKVDEVALFFTRDWLRLYAAKSRAFLRTHLPFPPPDASSLTQPGSFSVFSVFSVSRHPVLDQGVDLLSEPQTQNIEYCRLHEKNASC
jgi:hypothetical protein